MGSPDTPEAPKADYEHDIKSFTAGIQKSLPSILGAEGKYRDDFTKLNLEDVSDFLGGKKGIAALGGKYSKVAGGQLSDARKRDLKSMTDQAALTRSLLERVSPESAAMVKQAQEQALTAQKNAQGLTGQEARSAMQFARESGADRGREMDNSTIFGEALNRDSILGAKRQEAMAATNQAYNMANSFYSSPGLHALSSMPQSYAAGQGLIGTGLGAIGAARPQMIDIGAGLNLGAANRQNQFAANAAGAGGVSPGAAAGAGALSGAAAGAMVGSVVPVVGTAIGALGGAIIGGAGGYYGAR